MKPIKDAFAAATSRIKNRLRRADNQTNQDTAQERGNSVTKVAEEQNLATKQELKEMEQRIFFGLATLLKVCPACGHKFKGKGWEGFVAHWRSKHENIMPSKKALEHLKNWEFPRG